MRYLAVSEASSGLTRRISHKASGSFRGGLIVSDIEAAHKELVSRGVNASEVFHGSPFSPAGHRSRNDDLRFRNRSGKRNAARGIRPRPAREEQRAARRELAGLVFEVHGSGAGRDRTAEVNDYPLVTSSWMCWVGLGRVCIDPRPSPLQL